MEEFDQSHFNDVMAGYDEFLLGLDRESNRVNQRILNVVRNMKGIEYYNDLLLYIDESCVNGPFEIVRHPIGEYQKEYDYGMISDVWVSQQSCYEPDSYYGTVEVELKPNRWLRMPFSG